jgi:hypothetical protein
VVLLALGLPWLTNGLKSAGAGSGLLLGLWAHAVAVPPALALGAWSSRVVAGTAGRAAIVLVGGVVLALVLGLRTSPVPWLAPPLLPAARDLAQCISAASAIGATAWALAWSAVVLAGYAWLRRTRA